MRVWLDCCRHGTTWWVNESKSVLILARQIVYLALDLIEEDGVRRTGCGWDIWEAKCAADDCMFERAQCFRACACIATHSTQVGWTTTLPLGLLMSATVGRRWQSGWRAFRGQLLAFGRHFCQAGARRRGQLAGPH